MPMPLSRMVSVLAVGVEQHPHFEVGRILVQRRVVERLEAQLVAGVRRVGDQLAQEDLLVGVQRVGHQVQDLLDLGLEGMGLFAHVGSGQGLNGKSLAAIRRACGAGGRILQEQDPAGHIRKSSLTRACGRPPCKMPALPISPARGPCPQCPNRSPTGSSAAAARPAGRAARRRPGARVGPGGAGGAGAGQRAAPAPAPAAAARLSAGRRGRQPGGAGPAAAHRHRPLEAADRPGDRGAGVRARHPAAAALAARQPVAGGQQRARGGVRPALAVGSRWWRSALRSPAPPRRRRWRRPPRR